MPANACILQSSSLVHAPRALLLATTLTLVNQAAGATDPVRMGSPGPCVTVKAPPPPPAGAKSPAATAPAKPVHVVDAPLLDAKNEAKLGATNARAQAENDALADLASKIGGRQAGPAVERVRGVMRNGGQGLGMQEFGGLIAQRHFFPSTSSVVHAAQNAAAQKGWSLPQEKSPADIVLARTRPNDAKDTAPFRIEFLVPAGKQKEFEAFTAEVQKEVQAAALAELASRAKKWDFGSILGSVSKGADKLAPAVSLTIDTSQEFDTQLVAERQKTLEMIAASAYVSSLEKERFGLLGRPRGTVDRGLGRGIASNMARDNLAQAYGQPNNKSVQTLTNVAAASVLSEIANQPQLAKGLEQLAAAGAGSDLGVIMDAQHASNAANAFGVSRGEVGVLLRLSNGDVVALPRVTPNELAQISAWTALTPGADGKALRAKLTAIRTPAK